MGLETGTTLANLVTTNPAVTDPVSQGDDHLRLLKSVLKTQFPGSGGSGFATPITATEAEINYLSGVTAPIQGQLFPAGTKMLFLQVSPPTGWTLDTTYDGRMLYVNSAWAGGSMGGSHNPLDISVVPAHAHTGLTTPEDNSHYHTGVTSDVDLAHAHTTSFSIGSGAGSNSEVLAKGSSSSGFISDITSVSLGVHNHTFATSYESTVHGHAFTTDANSGASNIQPYYVSAIVCVKS